MLSFPVLEPILILSVKSIAIASKSKLQFTLLDSRSYGRETLLSENNPIYKVAIQGSKWSSVLSREETDP